MKKLFFTLACGLLATASLKAELPDLAKVWQHIQIKEYDCARNELDFIVEANKKPEGYHWEEAHSEQSSHDVEEWLHGYLIKFYIAYKAGDQAEMKNQAQNIHQLSYLEFMGRKDRPN